MPFDQVNFPLPAVETDEVLVTLIAARALIADANTWCRDAGYLNAAGARTAVENGDDVARCSWGAIRKVVGRHREMLDDPAFQHLQQFCNGNVIGFNDTHTHAEVLERWDRAIAARRAAIASSTA